MTERQTRSRQNDDLGQDVQGLVDTKLRVEEVVGSPVGVTSGCTDRLRVPIEGDWSRHGGGYTGRE